VVRLLFDSGLLDQSWDRRDGPITEVLHVLELTITK
jgi:hypothetical protein